MFSPGNTSFTLSAPLLNSVRGPVHAWVVFNKPWMSQHQYASVGMFQIKRLCSPMINKTGSVAWVMVKSSWPLRELALMGVSRVLASRPSLLANPQSRKLSSAPESISASMEMVTVWYFTWTGVSTRAVGVDAVVRLTNRVDLARQAATRCPDSPQ